MYKYSGFKVNSSVNKVILYLYNEETDSRIHIDCDMSLADYNLKDLISQEYQPVNSVKELIEKHKLVKRSQDYVKISSFKLGA